MVSKACVREMVGVAAGVYTRGDYRRRDCVARKM